MKRIIVALVFLSVIAQIISAKEVFNNVKTEGQRIYSNLEFDPAPAVTAGYAISFELPAIRRILTVSADIAVPIFLLDLRHYRIELGTRLPIFNSQSWNVLNRFSVMQVGTDNSVYSGTAFSIEEGLLMGYFSENWYAAGEINYRKFLFMHMVHSDWYREHVYADAIDGWYGSTGGMFTFGIQGGYTFADILEVTLRLGIYKTETFHDPVGLPFYANLGVVFH